MTNKKIGFIGVGLMGHGMAKNLIEKGFKVSVMGNRNRAPVDDLVKRGATEASSLAEMTKTVDVLFLCVTGTPEVERLVYGENGILASCRAGQIVADTSTSQPASTLKIATDFKPKGVRFIDTPLTRTPVEAEQGRLNTLVGCDAATFEEIKPVLAAFCENIFHIGEVGTGHKVKLINNFATIGQMALIAESLAACAKLGVDPKKYFQLVGQGAANSPLFQNLAGQAVEGNFKSLKFALVNASKDVRYYTQMTAEAGISGNMAAATQQTLLTAINLGFGTPDHMVSELVAAQAKLNGVRVDGK